MISAQYLLRLYFFRHLQPLVRENARAFAEKIFDIDGIVERFLKVIEL